MLLLNKLRLHLISLVFLLLLKLVQKVENSHLFLSLSYVFWRFFLLVDNIQVGVILDKKLENVKKAILGG